MHAGRPSDAPAGSLVALECVQLVEASALQGQGQSAWVDVRYWWKCWVGLGYRRAWRQYMHPASAVPALAPTRQGWEERGDWGACSGNGARVSWSRNGARTRRDGGAACVSTIRALHPAEPWSHLLAEALRHAIPLNHWRGAVLPADTVPLHPGKAAGVMVRHKMHGEMRVVDRQEAAEGGVLKRISTRAEHALHLDKLTPACQKRWMGTHAASRRRRPSCRRRPQTLLYSRLVLTLKKPPRWLTSTLQTWQNWARGGRPRPLRAGELVPFSAWAPSARTAGSPASAMPSPSSAVCGFRAGSQAPLLPTPVAAPLRSSAGALAGVFSAASVEFGVCSD